MVWKFHFVTITGFVFLAIPEGATLLTDLEAEQALLRIGGQMYSLSESPDKYMILLRLPE